MFSPQWPLENKYHCWFLYCLVTIVLYHLLHQHLPQFLCKREKKSSCNKYFCKVLFCGTALICRVWLCNLLLIYRVFIWTQQRSLCEVMFTRMTNNQIHRLWNSFCIDIPRSKQTHGVQNFTQKNSIIPTTSAWAETICSASQPKACWSSWQYTSMANAIKEMFSVL